MINKIVNMYYCNKRLCVLVIVTLISINTKASVGEDSLLTLGFHQNHTCIYGPLSYGAEKPGQSEGETNLDFVIREHLALPNGIRVFGSKKNKEGQPEVWSAFTRDGKTFREKKLLYQVPFLSNKKQRWITSELVLNEKELLLIQCQLGNPGRKGHPFYAFGGSIDGANWKLLQPEPLYKGQDALCVVWNKALGKYINYQTTYQPFAKRFPDNMENVRRVLHIRTSVDGLKWYPGESFGVDGPYLTTQQMILPDSLDHPDTEFYRFAVTNLGEFWVGIMTKYISQPPVIGKALSMPHGPLFNYEWWISPDGLNWDRPFRHTSNLNDVAHNFAYRLPAPLHIGEELRWPVGQELYSMNRKRMFYTYCDGNAEIVTRPIIPNGKPLSLEINFESISRKEREHMLQGYIMAELQDKDGNTIPGFEKEACIIRPGPQTSVNLKWGQNYLPSDLSKKGIRLRLLFRDVRLYSLSY